MPINKFTTLLDLARQAKIITGETATFDGKIQAGIPFSGYPTGVDTGTTVSLGVVSTQTAIFSGNTGTTIFDVSNPSSPNYSPLFSGFSGNVWTNPLFSATTSGLTLPITIVSADTQVVGPFWTLTQTGTNGDYVIETQYTGYSITYAFSFINDLGAPTTAYTSYSGYTTASQENFSAGTLDYKGPLDYISSVEDATIDGRLTTNKLTVTGGASSATTGYVLTQTGNTGEVGWVFNSASGTTDTNLANSDLIQSAGTRYYQLPTGYRLAFSDNSNLAMLQLNESDPSVVVNNGLNSTDFQVKGQTDLNTFYVDVATDSVGIGTASPQSRLHISQETGTTPSLIIQASGPFPATDNASVLFMNTTGPRWGMGIENVGTLDFEIKKLNNGEFDFGNSGETVVHLDWTNKNVGIGISTPTEKLHVDGNTKISGSLNIGTILSGTPLINLGLDSSGNVVTGTTGSTMSFWEESGSSNEVLIDKKGSSSYNVLGTSPGAIIAAGSGHTISNSKYSSFLGGFFNTISGTTSSLLGGNIHIGGSANAIYESTSLHYSNIILGGSSNISISSTNGVMITTSDSRMSGTVNSFIIGGGNHKGGVTGFGLTENESSGIIGGTNNIFAQGIDRSVIIGGNGLSATTSDTVYVPNLNINTLGGGASVNNLGIDVNGNVVVGTAGGGIPEATTATTTTIGFTGQTIYYDSVTPGTGNISQDLTGAKLGLIQKIYHNDATEPTYPGGWVLMGDAIYFTSQLNIIYAEWAGGSRVEYWYVQEQ